MLSFSYIDLPFFRDKRRIKKESLFPTGIMAKALKKICEAFDKECLISIDGVSKCECVTRLAAMEFHPSPPDSPKFY